MSFLHRPQSMLLRRALFQVHLWVGVAAGLYVFVVCVTGAALVFRIDLQRAEHPELFTPSPGIPADPATILERVQAAYPSDRVSGVDAPTTARPTYLAYVVTGDRFLTLLIDPVTARVLGELPERSWIRTVQDLHFDLLAGRTGRVINGIGAALLLILCLTGIVIWWQGRATWRRGLMVDPRRTWKRVTWDLHSAIGFWTGLVIAMWAVTGIYFAFPAQFRSAVNAMSPLTASRTPLSGARGPGAPPSWRDMIAHAQQRYPAEYVARVVLPPRDRDAFLVMFSAARPTPAGSPYLVSVYLDRYTGAVLTSPPRQARSAGDVVMAWVAPLHFGNFGGDAVRVAWLILGLAPVLLFATGLTMWWSRVARPARLIGFRRALTAPPRTHAGATHEVSAPPNPGTRQA